MNNSVVVDESPGSEVDPLAPCFNPSVVVLPTIDPADLIESSSNVVEDETFHNLRRRSSLNPVQPTEVIHRSNSL
jgi:hypothetical protein